MARLKNAETPSYVNFFNVILYVKNEKDCHQCGESERNQLFFGNLYLRTDLSEAFFSEPFFRSISMKTFY